MRLASLLFLAAMAFAASAGSNRWTESAPPAICGYGMCTGVASIAIDPFDSQLLYVITGGAVPIETGEWVSNPGLWRSSDGGATWTHVGAGSLLEKELDSPLVLRIARSNPRVFYVIARSTFYRSIDAGETWTKTELPKSYGDNVDVIVDPLDANRVYVEQNAVCTKPGCAGGVYRSDDGGRNWKLTGLEHRYHTLMAIDPSNRAVLYAIGGGRLHQTTNSAGSWKDITPASPADLKVTGIAVDPTNSSTLYITAGSLSVGLSYFMKTLDGGRTWRSVREFDGYSGFKTIITVDPKQPSQLLATTYCGGITRSIDGGETWTPLNDGLSVFATPEIAFAGDGRTFHAIVGRDSRVGSLYHFSLDAPRRRSVRY